jgi:ABC-type sugar transport system substrate-binding protein
MKHYTSYYISLILLLLPLCLSCRSGQEEKTFVIGVSQCTLEDSWRKAMILDMQVEASYYPKVELVVMNAEGDSKKQSEQIDELVKRKVDVLIISPNEINPVTPSAVAAHRAGIPTVILDRKINSDEYTTFIGADNYEIGRSAGTYIKSLKEGKLNIVEIWGQEGSSPAQERHQGFIDALAGYEDGRQLAF